LSADDKKLIHRISIFFPPFSVLLQVEMIFNSAIDQLSADDKKLPAVEGVLPLLKKGIGIHHGTRVLLCVAVCCGVLRPPFLP